MIKKLIWWISNSYSCGQQWFFFIPVDDRWLDDIKTIIINPDQTKNLNLPLSETVECIMQILSVNKSQNSFWWQNYPNPYNIQNNTNDYFCFDRNKWLPNITSMPMSHVLFCSFYGVTISNRDIVDLWHCSLLALFIHI